jgi:hypothetical protein
LGGRGANGVKGEKKKASESRHYFSLLPGCYKVGCSAPPCSPCYDGLKSRTKINPLSLKLFISGYWSQQGKSNGWEEGLGGTENGLRKAENGLKWR